MLQVLAQYLCLDFWLFWTIVYSRCVFASSQEGLSVSSLLCPSPTSRPGDRGSHLSHVWWGPQVLGTPEKSECFWCFNTFRLVFDILNLPVDVFLCRGPISCQPHWIQSQSRRSSRSVSKILCPLFLIHLRRLMPFYAVFPNKRTWSTATIWATATTTTGKTLLKATMKKNITKKSISMKNTRQ